ncbi:MAG: DUF3970 family protein [Clostridia bacterium]
MNGKDKEIKNVLKKYSKTFQINYTS